MSLKNRAFSAVRWTAFGASFNALFRILQVAVLARLLMPEDYGLMAMVAVVLSIGEILADFGLGSAYLQRRDVTPAQRSSLYWLNVAMGFLIMVLVLALSRPVAAFFGDMRLAPLLQLSASIYLLTALGQQLRMHAQKALDFNVLVWVEVLSTLSGFFVSVFLAVGGFGVYALVWGAIAAALVGLVLSWLLLARGWRPLVAFRLEDVRSFLGFGGAMVGNGLVSQVNMNIDLLLGGRLLAASQLGLYSVPRNFMLQTQLVINPIIMRVGFPLIAEIQVDIARVRNVYLRALSMTVAVNAPLYLGVAFFAEDIVAILLGSRWTGATELLRILALWGLVRSVANPVGSLLLGLGRADLSLKWNLAVLFLTAPMIWYGSTHGVVGLTTAMLVVQLLLYLPVWAFLVRPLCGAALGEYLVTSLKPMLLALLALLAARLLYVVVGEGYAGLLAACVCAALLYGVLSYLFNRGGFDAAVQLVSKPAS